MWELGPNITVLHSSHLNLQVQTAFWNGNHIPQQDRWILKIKRVSKVKQEFPEPYALLKWKHEILKRKRSFPKENDILHNRTYILNSVGTKLTEQSQQRQLFEWLAKRQSLHIYIYVYKVRCGFVTCGRSEAVWVSLERTPASAVW